MLKSLEAAENKDDTIEIVETLDALARSYVKAKQHSKAISVYKRIIELSSSPRTISVSTAMIGVEYAMLGVKDSCTAYFDNAIAIANNNQSLTV